MWVTHQENMEWKDCNTNTPPQSGIFNISLSQEDQDKYQFFDG